MFKVTLTTSYEPTQKRLKIFNIGDYMIVQIRLKQFSLGIVKKLHARSAGPSQILKKLSDNAYIIDLPQDFGIRSIFNIEDLVDYKGLI